MDTACGSLPPQQLEACAPMHVPRFDGRGLGRRGYRQGHAHQAALNLLSPCVPAVHLTWTRGAELTPCATVPCRNLQPSSLLLFPTPASLQIETRVVTQHACSYPLSKVPVVRQYYCSCLQLLLSNEVLSKPT